MGGEQCATQPPPSSVPPPCRLHRTIEGCSESCAGIPGITGMVFCKAVSEAKSLPLSGCHADPTQDGTVQGRSGAAWLRIGSMSLVMIISEGWPVRASRLQCTYASAYFVLGRPIPLNLGVSPPLFPDETHKQPPRHGELPQKGRLASGILTYLRTPRVFEILCLNEVHPFQG